MKCSTRPRYNVYVRGGSGYHDEVMMNVKCETYMRYDGFGKSGEQRSRENLQFLLFPKTSLLFHMMGHSRIANVRVGNFTQHKYLLHGVKKQNKKLSSKAI